MANYIASCSVLFFLFVTFFMNSSDASTYNVLTFGAKADGLTDATPAFLKTWASACSSVTAATITVPKGRYLIKPISFRGPCKNRITMQISGTIVAPTDYRVIGSSGSWILFIKVNRLSVFGGTLDAKGAAFWACRKSGKSCPAGARSIMFNWANDVLISGLTSINSQVSHLVINSCNNVVVRNQWRTQDSSKGGGLGWDIARWTFGLRNVGVGCSPPEPTPKSALVRNVKLTAPASSPNTDGIHLQSSTGVTITGSTLQTGDDCISIGPGTRNLLMSNIKCGPGHGISIGSLGKELIEDGVQNVTLTNAVFTGSDNGVRIKSWARPSNSFVTNVVFQNIVMNNVDNPIIIDQNYCPNNQGCPNQSSGVKISQITYRNVKGTSATPVAMIFDCSSSNPCRGIRLQDIQLTYMNQRATSTCKNTGGTSGGVVMPNSCL